MLAITGSQLCLFVDLFVPDQLHLFVELHSNATTPQTMTVFDVYYNVTRSEINLLAQIQLPELSAVSLIQLIVYVSDNTFIRNVEVGNGSCYAATNRCQYYSSLFKNTILHAKAAIIKRL
jgi:hypothetical protein